MEIVFLSGDFDFCSSLLYVNGQLLVDDDGIHGMVERCGTSILSASKHVLYIAGFQAGGGVGMELRYSGPDTGGSKVFVLPGGVPSSVSLHQNKRKMVRRPVYSATSSEPLYQVGSSVLLHSISALERQLQDQVIVHEYSLLSPAAHTCFIPL